MTSISAASAQTYQSPLQKLQDELLSEVKSGAIKSSDQDALVVGADRYRFGDAGEPRQRPGQRHAAVARRPEIEDRRPDRRRSFQRQADQRSGHRTAGRLQGGLRQRSRRRWRSGGPGGRRSRLRAVRRLRMARPPATTLRRARRRSTTSSSSSCNRCRSRCRLRHRRPTARPARLRAAAAPRSRRC